MVNGGLLPKRPNMIGPLNPRWARDGRVEVGQRFGFWTVLGVELRVVHAALYVEVRCDCGARRWNNLRFLENGRSQGCRACATRRRHEAEGHLMLKTPLDRRIQKRVNAWFQRCNNPKDKSYHNYGGRGIRVKFTSVKEGTEWVRLYLPHPNYWKLDIDRIDNDGHYEPGNLRLVTRDVNAKNKRRVASTTLSTLDLAGVLSLPG